MKITDILNEDPNQARKQRLANEKRKREKLEKEQQRSKSANKGHATRKKNAANIKHGEDSSFAAAGETDPSIADANDKQSANDKSQQDSVDDWAQQQADTGGTTPEVDDTEELQQQADDWATQQAGEVQDPNELQAQQDADNEKEAGAQEWEDQQSSEYSAFTRDKTSDEEKISQDYKQKKAELAKKRSEINTSSDVTKAFLDQEIQDNARSSDPNSEAGDQGASASSVEAYLQGLGYPPEEISKLVNQAPEKEQSDSNSDNLSDKEEEAEPDEVKDDGQLSKQQEQDREFVRKSLQTLNKKDLRWLQKQLLDSGKGKV